MLGIFKLPPRPREVPGAAKQPQDLHPLLPLGFSPQVRLTNPQTLNPKPFSPPSGLAREAKLPDQFGWLTESGVYTGRIDPWEGDSDSVTVDCLLISNGSKAVPKTAHITQFHVMQLFPDRIRAVCILNEQVLESDGMIKYYGFFPRWYLTMSTTGPMVGWWV